MSSCSCKNVEGVISPVFIEAVKDRENNPIHALQVDKANHGSRPSPHFDKAALNHVGRPQAAPQRLGKTVEAEQLREVPLQPLHHGRIGVLPASLKGPESRLRRLAVLGPVDSLRVALHLFAGEK